MDDIAFSSCWVRGTRRFSSALDATASSTHGHKVTGSSAQGALVKIIAIGLSVTMSGTACNLWLLSSAVKFRTMHVCELLGLNTYHSYTYVLIFRRGTNGLQLTVWGAVGPPEPRRPNIQLQLLHQAAGAPGKSYLQVMLAMHGSIQAITIVQAEATEP